MTAKWIERVTGSLEQKQQYRKHRARMESLPEPYATVAKALERYCMYDGGVTDGETAVRLAGDLADLWERAAAEGTPVRAIVGENPVEFAETFTQTSSHMQWMEKERARLTRTVDGAVQGGRK